MRVLARIAVVLASGALGGCEPREGGTDEAPELFFPAGCDFTIAARAEYQDWRASEPTVGATPSIRRVRLGLGGNVKGTKGRADPSTGFGAAWQTDEGTLVSEIQWGTSPDPSTWASGDTVSGITWDTPAGSPDGMQAERMHEAYVCGLTPATTYFYRVGGGGRGASAWSPVFRFTTTPAAGPTPVKIAITGDAQGEISGGLAPAGVNTWQLFQRKLRELSPTLALFSGDSIELASDPGEWGQWLDKSERDTDGETLALPSLLSLQAHGNHENHSPLFYGNVVLPQDNAAYPAYGELFYSVDVGPVHVVVIDNMYVTDGDDPHYRAALAEWLNDDLTAANVNRAEVPWIIAVHHYPDYSSSRHGSDPTVLVGRAFFAPIWQQHHVDMSFSGHDRDYERTYPLFVGSEVDDPIATTDALGTTFIVCAGAGAAPFGNGYSSFTAVSASFSPGALGIYGVLEATATSLTFTAHDLVPDGSDPVVDAYAIQK